LAASDNKYSAALRLTFVSADPCPSRVCLVSAKAVTR